MKLRHHDDPRLDLAFDYPATWSVRRGPSFQIVNSRAPHGAITITLLARGDNAETSGAHAAPVRFSFADRNRAGFAPQSVDTWAFAGDRVSGFITYAHGGQPEPAEIAEATAIIDSLVICPVRARGSSIIRRR